MWLTGAEMKSGRLVKSQTLKLQIRLHLHYQRRQHVVRIKHTTLFVALCLLGEYGCHAVNVCLATWLPPFNREHFGVSIDAYTLRSKMQFAFKSFVSVCLQQYRSLNAQAACTWEGHYSDAEWNTASQMRGLLR